MHADIIKNNVIKIIELLANLPDLHIIKNV